MLELITDPQVIRVETGFDPVRDASGGVATIDAPNSHLTLLVRTEDGTKYLLARHAEAPNLACVGNARKIFFAPYFAFSNLERNRELARTWIDAMEECFLETKDVRVYPDVTFDRYCLLADKYHVHCDYPDDTWRPTFVYMVNKNEVLSLFSEDRRIFDETSTMLCDSLARGAEVRCRLAQKDNRFEVLDTMLEDMSLDVLVCSSPFVVQELSSIGMYHPGRPAMLGLYRRGDSQIYILSRQSFDIHGFLMTGVFSNEREAMDSLVPVPCSVGIDGAHLAMRRYRSLGLERDSVTDVSVPLRVWREATGGLSELGCHVIAVQAARMAIDGALRFATQQIHSGQLFVESDVVNHMRKLIQEFAREHGLDGHISVYHDFINAGDRTLIPSRAANHVLTKNVKTLHIDAGARVVDSSGRLRAVSDLARTATFNDESADLYAFLQHLATDKFVPAARAGLRGKDMYSKYIEWLEPHTEEFKRRGLMPMRAEMGDITRNAGHALGAQQPIAIQLKADGESELKSGMICCVEFKWPFDETYVGYEDEYLVTEDEGLSITL